MFRKTPCLQGKLGRVHDLYAAPLDPSRHEIRLLEIVSSRRNHRISCRLHTVSLQDNPRFTALSYVWGDPSKTRDIMLDGMPTKVTVNLKSALRNVLKYWQTSFPGRDLSECRLWVDALCINQADHSERGQQVAIMYNIYSSAELVISWLGLDDKRKYLRRGLEAFEVIYQATKAYGTKDDELLSLEWLKPYPRLSRDDPALWPSAFPRNRAWLALGQVTRATYWSRLWVLQEMLLARRLVFVTSTYCLPGDHFLLGCQKLAFVSMTLTSSYERPRPDFVGKAPWADITGMDSFFRDLGMLTLLGDVHAGARGILQEPVVDLEDFTGYQPIHYSWQLFWLGLRLQPLRATDPRDLIYGRLAVAPVGITPDYSPQMTTPILTRTFIRMWLEHYRSNGEPYRSENTPIHPLWFLAIMSGIANISKPDVQSWLPDFAVYRAGIADAYGTWRAFIGVFEQPPVMNSVVGRSLFVEGIEVDRVRRREIAMSMDSLESGELANFVHTFCRRHQTRPTGASPLTILYNIIVRHGSFGNGKPPPARLVAFVDFIIQQSMVISGPKDVPLTVEAFLAEHDVDTAKWFAELPSKKDWRQTYSDSAVTPVWNAMKEVLRYSGSEGVIFETEMGYLGHGRAALASGDVVCILNGLGWPAIMRQASDRYLFIGISWIYGLMDGEASELRQAGQSMVQQFEII